MASLDKRESVIESCWIMDLVGYMEKAGLPGEPVLECYCQICQESLLNISTSVGEKIEECAEDSSVRTLQEFYEKYNLERCVFLRCGHFFGERCLEEYRKSKGAKNPWYPYQCPWCRADNSCNGCLFVNPTLTLEVVPWPLKRADWRPYETFMSSVTLTAAEIATPTKRFCAGCMKSQISRQWAQLVFLGPTCCACDNHKYGRTADWTKDHRVGRDAVLEDWLRDELALIADCIFPSTADLRDREWAALVEEPRLAAARAAWVDQMMDDDEFGGPLKRILFHPCDQETRAGGEVVAPITRAELEGFIRVLKRMLRDAEREHRRLPLGWYRGDQEFTMDPVHPKDPAYFINLGDDPDDCRSFLTSRAGTATFIQTMMLANPLSLTGFELDPAPDNPDALEIISRLPPFQGLLFENLSRLTVGYAGLCDEE